jgi:hypothetical protein
MKREYHKMGLVSFIGCISVLFILIMFAVTNYTPDIIFAFHQNYPEFNDKDDVKDLYEILKDSPFFKSKIVGIENITNEVSKGCNIDTLVFDETNDTARSNIEICDEDIQAMKAECDKHYNVMSYCKDKSDFMNNYLSNRNLTAESVGKVATSSAVDLVNIQQSSNDTDSSNSSNITNHDSNLKNRSGDVNVTIPEELPPESINGSQTGKI